MRLRTVFLVGAVAIVHTSASAQINSVALKASETPVIRVGLFRVNTEGQIVGSAANTGDRAGSDLAGTVYVAPCSSVGAASPSLPIAASATDVWRLTGSVLELSPEQASAQITWQRVRKGGAEDTSAPQSLTVTLTKGERTTLETISIPPRGSCAGMDASLDVAFLSTIQMVGRGPSGGAVRVGGDRIILLKGSGGEVSQASVPGASVLAPSMVSADLWLVRTAPGHPDETRHLASAVVQAPLPFAFAPLTIQNAAGVFTVTVKGTIESGFTPAGEPQLYFSANRTTSFAPANRAARDGPPVVEGSTKTTVPLPGPDDVLSFEMPPLRVPGGAAVPDKLSVRVKLTRETTPDAKPR